MSQLSENIHVLHDNFDVQMTGGGKGDVDAAVFGIMGAMGGVGVTTIAVQLAYYLSRGDLSKPDTRTALLSLDFENSAISQYLDIRPNVTIEDFKQAPSVVDDQFIERVMSPTPFGFHVLALPNVLGGNDLVNSDCVLSFLDSLCQKFDSIVLDTPRLWAPWTHAAIGAADKVAMVTDLSVPGLRLASERGDALLKAVDQLDEIDFVINKLERRSFRNSLKIGDAERALGLSPIPALPINFDQIRDAINKGEPVGVTAKDSRFVRESNDLFADWVAAITSSREREQTGLSTQY